ncbi:MAG: iron-sulfur cluster assembly scaffold protein, partial [Solirubrobacteraceae bacterium]
MDAEAFAEHLEFPRGRGHAPPASFSGTAGGAACGDLIRLDLRVEGDRVADAGFDASGCGAAVAAGSAAVALASGATVLGAARIGTGEVAAELGGLSPGKL